MDFYIPELKLCLEYDGDYWHGVIGNKERDAIREQEIKNTIEGIEILHIAECDYKEDEYGTVDKCVEFINERIRRRDSQKILRD